MDRWYIIPLTAAPWAIGPLSVGRKGGKPFAFVGPNHQLVAFQEALKEELEPAADLLAGEVDLSIYIWRKLEKSSSGGRARKAHQADATNMQKGIEDAIQGVLIENDRNVRRVKTEIMEQDESAESCIVIRLRPYESAAEEIPDYIWASIDQVTNAPTAQAQLPLGSTGGWSNPSTDPLKDVIDLADREFKRGQGGTFDDREGMF